MATKITINRISRRKTPRFVKQNKRSKYYVESIKQKLKGVPEIERRADLTAKQHNMYAGLPLLWRLKIPAMDGVQNSKKSFVMFKAGHRTQEPNNATQRASLIASTGMPSNFHPGLRQMGNMYVSKSNGFKPVPTKGSNIEGTPSIIGSNRRSKRSLTW